MLFLIVGIPKAVQFLQYQYDQTNRFESSWDITCHLEVRGHYTCKEMPVIPVNKVVDKKSIIGKTYMAQEVERHKGFLTPSPHPTP
jgi:hypothetical protein